MVKAGVLIHVYHLEAVGWEGLVWGDAKRDMLGSLPKLVQLLLTLPADETIDQMIIYTGPSTKDGLGEGAYAKQYLLDHFSSLGDFPRLTAMWSTLTPEQKEMLRAKIEAITLGPQLVNTFDEVQSAAQFFSEHAITKVYQLTTATHAPRCVQMQAVIRSRGDIPTGQQWLTILADTSFGGTKPDDLVIIEPPHRGDDPLLHEHPNLGEVIRPFYRLPAEKRIPTLHELKAVMDHMAQE